MKPIHEVLTVFIVLIGGSAQAAGGGNTQGTLVGGTGLDWQRGGTELQRLPKIEVAEGFPNISGIFKVNAAGIVLNGNCSPISYFAARCEATVSLLPKRRPNQLCGHWLEASPNTKKLWMYVLAAKPNGNGAFIFPKDVRSSKTFYFGCDTTDQTDPGVDWDDLGAIGKCMLWPKAEQSQYWPKKEDLGREFNACIRAVRADYCGNGTSHTKDGTTISLYRSDAYRRDPLQNRDQSLTLEATWDDKGAICIIHARYKELSPQCRRGFSIVLSDPNKKDDKGNYYCEPSRFKDNNVTETNLQRMLKSSMLANDSRIQ